MTDPITRADLLRLAFEERRRAENYARELALLVLAGSDERAVHGGTSEPRSSLCRRKAAQCLRRAERMEREADGGDKP